MTTDDVIYHGHANDNAAGARLVTVETPDGQLLGQLGHLVMHSPTGMNWGYGGSGPSDLARSLLVAALGDEAVCPDCAGTGHIAYGLEPDEDVPYDPDVHGHPGDANYEAVARCSCTQGIRRDLPYQDFKWTHVAKWDGGADWSITQAEIRDWFRQSMASRSR